MSSRLELSRAPRAASAWCAGRDSAALAVLCAGAEQAGAWYVRAGARRYLLLSEQEAPPPDAEYWALRPRVRLALPGTEGDREGEPAAERPKMPDSASNPAPEPVAPAVKTSYLKVKAFARMAPEPAPASREPAPAPSEAAEAAAPRTDDTAEKLLAPARVFVNNVIYQKLSDDPLVYAKVLVAVPSSKACRALLARGAALQMYCLRSGRLYPLQAEPKKDVSRITLTGDEEISGALMALAKQLYNPSDVEEETEQESDADPEQDREHVIEIQNTTEHMLEDLEPRQQVGQAIQPTSQPSSQQNQTSKDGLASKQLRDAHSVLLNILSNKTIQIQPSPGSTVTTVTTVTTVATAPPRPPLTKPGEVIELSDED
ncbi:uncharacterized protein LOC133531876 [Cydia pomonella]|uniref:uncharacterized protein LOC133531876 n=1 Tax=Cydia pomonella TaxID=82600 RepID=UPI002ADDF4A2|nr:uncharacterized protein LOC133531876 [Cydia pomonella]